MGTKLALHVWVPSFFLKSYISQVINKNRFQTEMDLKEKMGKQMSTSSRSMKTATITEPLCA